jgi:transposase InsO family protein
VLCAAAHNTYIRTWVGWLYLATVIDCATKACIGYAMADHMRTPLVVEALEMAANRYDITGAIFHSDYAEPCVKPRNRGFACVGGVR